MHTDLEGFVYAVLPAILSGVAFHEQFCHRSCSSQVFIQSFSLSPQCSRNPFVQSRLHEPCPNFSSLPPALPAVRFCDGRINARMDGCVPVSHRRHDGRSSDANLLGGHLHYCFLLCLVSSVAY
jgi:hypothetical protein